MMLKMGCSEQILEVPLFAELYGYGPFAGRRNQGTRDPLYCRAVSFNEEANRSLIVYTDTCTTDDLYAREMRSHIATKFNILPENIAFVATHTHSAPKLGRGTVGVAWGEPLPEFQGYWKESVVKVAAAALANEENIFSVESGTNALTCKLGRNRVDVEKNITDPTIRWMRFLRKNGSCKLLLHNHGIHGVANNGSLYKMVSADWMGAANRIITERGLADMPLFLLGSCGDINPYLSCGEQKDETVSDLIGKQYVDDLEKGITAGGKKLNSTELSGVLHTYEFPTVAMSVNDLEKEAEEWHNFANTHENPMAVAFYENFVNRLQEMIILAKQGKEMRSFHDLQILRIGPASIYFIPGEFFIEPGMELLEKSPAEFSFAATVSNGNGTYFPSLANMKKYPSIQALNSKGSIFGFYEIYGYMHSHRFKYDDHIADFIINKLMEMEHV